MGINPKQPSSGVDKNPANDAFLRKLMEEVEANIGNEQFSVEELADRMCMSRSHLHRKLKQTTGQSVNQFIREYRLQQAIILLREEDKTVSQVAFEVGFGSPSYFTTCFAEYYGYPPGEARYRLNQSGRPDSPSAPPVSKDRGHTRRINRIVVGGFVLLCLAIVVLLYRQLTADSPNPEGTGAPGSKSIAVLPFRHLNVDSENEYFSEGVVEAINRHLSGIGDLKVISLTSTDRYRESNKSAREIGKELNVSNLLEGSIQREEDMVRIEVRLIDAGTEGQVWAENYDRELEDIFKTQGEIAEKVVLALKARLSPEEKAVFDQSLTGNAEAYDLYLKGKYEYRTYTRNGNHRALQYFTEAVAIDPNYAPAHAGLGVSYISKASIFGTEMSALEALALAKPHLDKALELDPNLVEAHIWNGFYLLYNNWDFEGAEQEYRRAIVTDDPDALAIYADFLNFIRRHQEALEISERLDQTNPYYPNSRKILALYYSGRYDEAVEFARQRMVLFNNYLTLDNFGFVMLNTGNYQEAISLFSRALEIEGIRYPRILGWMGAAHARAGQEGEALKILEELKAKRKQTDAGSLAYFIAVIYAALDDKTSTLKWLQQAYNDHEMEIPWLKSEPQFYPLHEDPAFQELLNKVGFP